jgi:hypothetical protein
VRHRANTKFWQFYSQLPDEIQRLADEKYDLLKTDPRHPSLDFKKVGRTRGQNRLKGQDCEFNISTLGRFLSRIVCHSHVHGMDLFVSQAV